MGWVLFKILEIFYLYKVKLKSGEEKNILIRCTRRAFPNYSQTKEDSANSELESKKDALLENYISQNLGTIQENVIIEFLGEMRVDKFGDELHEEAHKELTV